MMIGQKLYAWKIRHFVKFHWKFVCERLVNAVHLHSVSISRIYVSKELFVIWIAIVIDNGGQLILNCLFDIFKILPKNERKSSTYYYGTSSRIVFVPFLGELKTPKRHLE